MTKCLVCRIGEIATDSFNSNWYRCENPGCRADSEKLIDGFMYPLTRRGTLCSLYTPARDLDVKKFFNVKMIVFQTSRNSKKQAKILHVNTEDNMMIIEEIKSGKIRFIIDYEKISDAYSALFSVNKVKYAGWWNRRIHSLSIND